MIQRASVSTPAPRRRLRSRIRRRYLWTDMETAAVAQVANANTIPFIAFRALSDGLGDPLHLPGFPFQFFYYRQLAADNAAEMTLAFLQAWSTH
ncbi:MAG: hypothetical protein LC750_11155 [Actinobacteria bacterium]|nr:hypothetical protein [Actinomycetota bacterium]